MSVNPEKENLNGIEEQATPTDTANTEIEAQKTEDKKPEPQSTIFVKHVYDTKKPIESGGKKRVLTVIVSIVLCIALAVGVFVIVPKLLPEDSANSSSTQSTVDESTITVLKKVDIMKDAEIELDGKKVLVDTNIESVYIVNGYEEFTIRNEFIKAEKEEKKEDTTSSTSSTSSSTKKEYLYDTVWYVDGIDKSKTVSSAILDAIEDCLNIRAFREMENSYGSVEEYHEHFGMKDKLTAGFVVRFNDGTEDLTVSVGDALATNDSYYLMTSLSDTVYAVEAEYAEHYFRSTKEFADPVMIPALKVTDDNKSYFNSGTNQLARFDKIKVYGDVFGDTVYEFKMSDGISADYMPYQMTAPYNRPASDAFIAEILSFAQDGLEASVLYSYSVTDKDIEEGGFEKPKGIIELAIGDYSYKLIIGGVRNDGTESFTAMVEGEDMVYGIDQDELAFIINASNNESTMFNTNFILEEIYTVERFDIQIGSEKHSFDLKHTPRENDEKVIDTEVKLGGTIMNEAYFKRIYGRVLMLTLMEFVTEAEETEPVMTVTFHFIGDSKPRVVKFTESPDDKYHYTAWVDGTPLGEVLKSSIDDVINCVDLYLNGSEVPDTW